MIAVMNFLVQIASSLSLVDGDIYPLKLRFLHLGNIFMDGEHCLIGMENMLLGCRPCNYVKFRDYVQCIDAVMFGEACRYISVAGLNE